MFLRSKPETTDMQMDTAGEDEFLTTDDSINSLTSSSSDSDDAEENNARTVKNFQTATPPTPFNQPRSFTASSLNVKNVHFRPTNIANPETTGAEDEETTSEEKTFDMTLPTIEQALLKFLTENFSIYRSTSTGSKKAFISLFSTCIKDKDLKLLMRLDKYMDDVQLNKIPDDTYFILPRTETSIFRFSQFGNTSTWCKLQLVLKDELMKSVKELGQSQEGAYRDEDNKKIPLAADVYAKLDSIFNAQRGRIYIPLLVTPHAMEFRAICEPIAPKLTIQTR